MPVPNLGVAPVAGRTLGNFYAPGTTFEKSSFSATVRARHLNALPTFNSALGAPAKCAYCGDDIGRRAMRIDHIIPMRIYCRYKLLSDPRLGGYVLTENSGAVSRLVDEYFGDDDNLLLACQNCNGRKKEAMPNINDPIAGQTWLASAVQNLPHVAMQAKLHDINTICTNLPLMHAATQLFIMNGTTANTSIMNTRKRVRDTTPPAFLMIQAALIDRLSVSRPDHGQSNEDLEPLQGATAPAANRPLRPCLYCLGLFMDQAFQLDHIRPINRSRVSEHASKQRYNDPANIIPVCGSCNGSKSNNKLTKAWMRSRLNDRVADGLPGLAAGLSDAEKATLEHQRNIIFGLA